jgi:molecular chaperone DnaK (HSP70)
LNVLTFPIDKVLQRAGKNMTDIDVVELVGGGTRIPVI